jgi:peptidoglycan/LPS O-acetylase OafA/YrhL
MSTTLRAPAPLSARTDRSTARVIRKFRPDIEGLRAVAVTLVVLAHLGLGFPGGYIGVDVFFVISGFLITRQLMGEVDRTNGISFRRFYARRVRRILPAATVVIIGTMLACWKWDSPLQVKSDALDGLYSAFSGINWRLAAGGTNYFSVGAAPSPFQHFWSLAVEEQFYLVWPVLLLAIGVLVGRRYGWRKSIVWTLLLIMAVSLFLSIRTTGSSPSWAYFGTQTRAWELAFGALIAVTVDVWTRMPPALASQMSWLGLGLIGLSSIVFTSSTEFPGAAVILPVAGSAFVIAGGCPGWSRSAEWLLKRRPMQFLGSTSYSWYLVHWPVLTILPLALDHALTFSDKWLVLFGSLAIAVLMHYVIEQPIRARPWLVRRPGYSLALGCALVATSIGTAAFVFSGVTIPGGGGPRQTLTAAGDLKAVKKAVAAGAGLIRLPSNVTPSLARASTDRPFTTGHCLVADSVAVPPPDSRCTFGDLHSHRVMVVVGDSHANAWTPAIDIFAIAHHWKIILYAKAACPPGLYPNDVDPLTNRLYTQCNEWRQRVWSGLDRLKPKVVLVTSELRTLDIDPGGMVTAIRDYESTGAKVIYLEDTPSPDNVGSVPDCLARNANRIQTCSLPRMAPATRLNGFIQRRVETAAAKRAGATLIDPTSWFCTASVCPPVINDMIVYADNSHTTATYVRWLSPVLSTALEKAIK